MLTTMKALLNCGENNFELQSKVIDGEADRKICPSILPVLKRLLFPHSPLQTVLPQLLYIIIFPCLSQSTHQVFWPFRQSLIYIKLTIIPLPPWSTVRFPKQRSKLYRQRRPLDKKICGATAGWPRRCDYAAKMASSFNISQLEQERDRVILLVRKANSKKNHISKGGWHYRRQVMGTACDEIRVKWRKF